jgi:hypothetical protein
VLRLRQIALVARSLSPVVEEIRTVFGLEVAYRDPSVSAFGLENAVFAVGQQFLEVVAPVREGTAAGRYLDRRGGDGGYMVILQCDDHPARKRRVGELGVRTAFEHDEPAYHILQLHPRDTGGSFLEIDEQIGGEDLDGPWQPAGPNWQSAVRTAVVRGIAAAEIQSPGPQALARRWSEILDVPIGAESAQPATLRLDNASLRFVRDHDGRGEGLGGVDLVATDPGRALTAAEQRGRRGGDQVVLLCGVRFRLLDGQATPKGGSR